MKCLLLHKLSTSVKKELAMHSLIQQRIFVECLK